MSFGNPIVGGTTLVRPAIKSPNYIVNTAGWTINADGTAEFNQVVVRGEVKVTAPSGAFVDIVADASNAFVDINPPNLVGHTIAQASLYGASNASFTSLTIDGPAVDGNSKAQIEMLSYTAGGSELDLFANSLLINASDFVNITGGPVVDFSNTTSVKLSGTNVDGNLHVKQSGQPTVNLAAVVAQNTAVLFPSAYAVGVVPQVFCNLDSGAGAAGNFTAKAIAVSNTGFTIRVYNPAGVAGTFASTVSWVSFLP